MRTSTLLKSTTLLILLILFNVSYIQADSITYTDQITGEWSGENLGSGVWDEIYDVGSDQFEIPGFISSFGTLDEIQFSLTVEVYGDVAFTNTTNNSGTLERDTWGSINTISIISTEAQTETLVLPVGPRETVSGSFGPVINNASTSENGAAFLSSYIDPAGGTVILDAWKALNPGGTIYGDGGVNFTGNIIAYTNVVEGTLDVTYIYTPATGGQIPEPSTMILLSTGLGALGLVAYRRKKK